MKKETLKTIGLILLLVAVICLLMANAKLALFLSVCEKDSGEYSQLKEACWFQTEYNETWTGKYYCDENKIYFFDYSKPTPINN